MLKIFLNTLFYVFTFLFSYSQKISTKELLEQPSNAILSDNFYQIKLDDYNNFVSSSSSGFLQNDKCFIQNFQSEDGLKGQIVVQLDFAGKIQFLGISKIFIDKYKKILKPKIFLIDDLEGCNSDISSNWNKANCIMLKIVLYLSN
jgi:hypothetical protein